MRRFLDDPAYLAPVFNRPEEWRTDVYNFPLFPYEGLYLALPVMHHWIGKHPPGYENVDSRKTVELACSRDLRRWQRVAGRAPFLELSPVGDGSAYDTGQVVVTNGPVRRNDELWFYYTGLRHRSLSFHDEAHRGTLDASAVCLARMRIDGFVGLKGGVEWGAVTSKTHGSRRWLRCTSTPTPGAGGSRRSWSIPAPASRSTASPARTAGR